MRDKIWFRSRIMAAAAFAVLALSMVGSGHTSAVAQDYKTLLAAPDRAAADVENDKKREALKLLEFTGAKPGWTVLDMGAGGGYSTELMARSVGSGGKVFGQSDKASERFSNRLKTPAMSNTVALVRPYDDPLSPDAPKLDLITFFFAYHDTTFMDVDRPKMNRAMFDALKPGGFLVVADHSARPGEGATVGKTTHRIEESTLVSEITAVGFKHVATGDFLRNPDDPRTVSVHRSGIRNDEFVVKFQKPL